ncbi:family 78 glycoside hydrolase catalytic domain [uncultured Draconibacterium sp.]|uniref:family 78 glycoside hydrolase catalytic domain n=1 Tax=uncultured Draconibacterium sp. TaxID=1573823 RepID=UPI003261B7BA
MIKILNKTLLIVCSLCVIINTGCKKENIEEIEAHVEFISNLNDSPTFSWKPFSGKKEVASQILVSDNIENIKKNVGNLWDTGKNDLNPVQTKYEGAQLQGGKRYFAKISLWDTEGLIASKTLKFFAPLKYPENWQAKWLTYSYNKHEPLPVFSKVFSCKSSDEIDFARLYVCAPGFYEAYLNGQKVGENVLDPGQTNYDDFAYYSVYDLDPTELKSQNSLGIMLGNGWFNQNQVWGNGLPYGQPVFICQLQIQYKNGEQELICSDTNWKWKSGPITYSNIYGGETYNANLEVDFSVAEMEKQDGWKKASIASYHPTKLFEQFAEPIKKMGHVDVKKIFDLGENKYIFDFGQNFTGWAQLQIQGDKGQEITMRFVEEIDSTGNIDPTSTGVNATKVIQTSKYICKGEGTEIWEPRFTYHGFRYAEVTGLNEKPSPDLLKGVVVYSAVPQIGNFTCSEENINKLHELALWTLKGNIQGIPTDCPHRERCGWTGDAHALAKSLLYNFDAQRFLTKYMLDMRSSARNEVRELYFGENFNDRSYIIKPNGIPTMIVPGKRTSGTASPDWGTAMAQLPWYIYLQYGDEQIIKEFYNDIKVWVEYIHAKNKDGIITHGLGDWCPPGGNKYIDCPVPISSSAFHILDVYILKSIAQILGNDKDFQHYSKMHKELKTSFNKHFYDSENHSYGTQTANALALDIDIVPESKKHQVAAAIVDNIHNEYDGFINTGIFGLGRIFKVLCENGFEDEAYRLLSKKDNRSFATMWNKFGATTLWEALPTDVNFDHKILQGRSHSHPMQSGFDSWFYSGIAGINISKEQPGFKKIIFKPYLTNHLSHASASYESKYGTIASSWKKEGESFHWEIEIPSGVEAQVYLPYKNEKAKISMNGEIVSDDKFTCTDKVARFKVLNDLSSGKYEFVVVNYVNIKESL